MKSKLISMIVLAALGATVASADELITNDGRTFVGKVLSRDAREVRFLWDIGGATAEMVFSPAEIKSIKLGPLPKPEPPPTPAPPPKPDAPPEEQGPEEQRAVTPTKPVSPPEPPPAELNIDARIDKAGRTPPDWWDSQPANFPKTLDMTWPDRPQGPWDANRNLNQYFIEVINRNASRAKEGAKAAHQALADNKDNPQNQFKAMLRLGQIYGVLLDDHERGAFWYRRAARISRLDPFHATNLAYCYWRLGSPKLAVAEMDRSGYSMQSVRMLGQIGQTDRAIQLARGGPADAGSFAAGDICRHAGRFAEAADFYRKAVANRTNNQKIFDLSQASAEAMAAFEKIDLARTPDGLYTGRSAGGYRGPVTVELAVRSGKIIVVRVTQHKEDWPMHAIQIIPARIIDKQSVTGIDTVTGATFTAGAIINAAGNALGPAAK